MPDKKYFYDPDEIIKLIVLRFGSVGNFAKEMGYTRANVYQKVKAQTAKFIGEIIKSGIDLGTINSGNTNAQSIGDITNTNKSGGTNELLIKNLLDQIEELKRERDSLKGQCLELTGQLNLLRGRDGSNKSPKNRERDYNKRKQL